MKEKIESHSLEYYKNSNEYYLNGSILDPFESQMEYNHSPDGFNHGYNGSGPSQLALAIMLKLTGKNTDYIRFRREIIAELPKDIDYFKCIFNIIKVNKNYKTNHIYDFEIEGLLTE